MHLRILLSPAVPVLIHRPLEPVSSPMSRLFLAVELAHSPLEGALSLFPP